jgi:hypothetical protein
MSVSMDDDNLDFDASVYDKPLSLSWKPREGPRRTFAKAAFGQKLRAPESISKSRRVEGGATRSLDSDRSSPLLHRPSRSKDPYQNRDETSSGSRSDFASSQSSFATQKSHLLPASTVSSGEPSQSVDQNSSCCVASQPGDDDGYRNIFTEPSPRKCDRVKRKAPPPDGLLSDALPQPMQSQSTQGSTASSMTHSTKATTTRSRDWSSTQNGARRKRARQELHHRRSGWLSDDDSPRRAEKASISSATVHRHPAVMVAGVRVDAHAAADAGSTQFFRDEVLWCCSNIVGSNVQNRLQAATDLAILISDTATYPLESIVHDDVLRALIQVLSFCKELVIEEESKEHAPGGTADTANEVKLFVVMVLHYLSMFCCDERHKRTRSRLHSNNSAHRAVRKSFVSSTDVLQGILCLVLADPRVAQIRGKRRRVSSLCGSNMEQMNGSPAEPDGSQSTVASSVVSTPDSVASSHAARAASATSSNDPTRAGRLRRVEKRRANGASHAKLSPILEVKPAAKKALAFDEADELSFVSSGNGSRRSGGTDNLSFRDDGSSAAQDKPQKKLSALIKRVSRAIEGSLIEHACGTEPDVWSEAIPLLALSRIMTGKLDGNLHSAPASTSSEKEIATFSILREEEEEAVIRDDRLIGGSGLRFWEGNNGVDESETGAEDTTVHVGNRDLAEAGIVSLLATAVADTLSAVVRLLSRDCRKGRRQKAVCAGCVSHFCERLRMLVSIVDASCLFCDENRVTFCQGGYSDELGGYLIVGLVSVLSCFCDAGHHNMFVGVWGDIVLETLRALLTLTHENKVAARELEVLLHKRAESGLGVISRVLHASTAIIDAESADNKHKYDCSIFCLNILTNYLESGGSCLSLYEIPLTNGASKVASVPRPFLSWLAAWLVDQTSTFRDAVMESTFGSSPSKHSSRTLQGNEDEKLVMAGNGFVLLAWVLVGDDTRPAPLKVCETIEAELPGSDPATKRTFLRNTLKAFCNFYHASVGDVSVVIVDPVKKLIRKLESDA